MTGIRASFGLSQIGQIALTVSDLERAVAFYRDRLGMRFLFRVPNLAFFDCDGIRLMLSLPEGSAESGTSSVIYFRVDDLDAAFEALRARGVVFVDSPHLIAQMADYDLWMCFLRDPDGHLLGLMSERPKQGQSSVQECD